MIKYFLWTASFIGLYISTFWVQVVYMKEKLRKQIKDWPGVSIIIPAHNEEKTLEKTVSSLAKANYPNDKLQIIIMNDGSTDKTKDVAEQLIQKYPTLNIVLINRVKKKGEFGKAPGMNVALKRVSYDFVGCLDADSTIEKNAIKKMLPYFYENDQTGAVISTIKVANPHNVYSKLQRLEYIFSAFVRSLMSKIDTLHVTPGALSIYRTKLLKKLGGFDENTLTEDYEIAMRLKFHNYNIKMQTEAVSYTDVPDSFKALWNQRVRWFRGFITTATKYKGMFANKKYGLMGLFQYPINILSFLLVLSAFAFLFYGAITKVYKFISKLIAIRWDVSQMVHFPDTKEIIYSLNPNLLFPIVISFMVAIYIYHRAHRQVNEPWKYPAVLLVYFFIYPLVRGAQWLVATYKESFKVKSKW